MNFRIKWDKYPEYKTLIPDFLKERFETYIIGEYIREEYLTQDLIGLNNFLQELTKQELDIFLNLKGEATKEYSKDKTFTEILLYTKMHLLFGRYK